MHDWPITFPLPHGLTIGGITSWAVRLGRDLADAGKRVRFVVHESADSKARFQITPPPNIECLAAPDLKRDPHLRESIALYRDLLPSIFLPCILAESYALAAALAAANPEHLRVLGWCHSDNPYDYAYLTYYRPIISRYIANTSQCRDELHRRLPNAAPIDLLPHGIKLPSLPRREPLNNRPIRLIYAGRLEHLVKRVLDLPLLAAELHRRAIPFQLRIIGDGPASTLLDEAIARFNHDCGNAIGSIQRLDPLPPDQLDSHWSWADASLLLSEHEGLSMQMLEAMAAACIPIITRIPSGTAEWITDGETGFTFPVGIIPTLAEKIELLVNNEPMRRQVGESARRRVESECDNDAFVNRIASTLDRVVREPPRPWPLDRPILPGPRGTAAAPDIASSWTITPGTESRLRRLLLNIHESDSGPVAIYGAGAHTIGLAAVWADSPVEIRAVIDDDRVRAGSRLWGWPILTPDRAAQSGAKTIIISSAMHESAIWARRAELERQGLSVRRIHGEPVDDPASSSKRPSAHRIQTQKPTLAGTP